MRVVPLKESPHPCGYFDDRQALFEHYLVDQASESEREVLLATGYRAFGKYVFRPKCEGCQRCIPIRIPVRRFRLNKSQRRVAKKCAEVELTVGPPELTEEKYAIYCEHSERFPRKEGVQGFEDFRFSFYEPSVPTLEFCYYLEGRLIAVGIVHETALALSSVYFTYRLDYSHLSLGTFSVLKEIEFAAGHGKTYHYLGYYIRDNHFMAYKGSYYPSEVLLDARGWVPFRDGKGTYVRGDDLGFEPFAVFS